MPLLQQASRYLDTMQSRGAPESCPGIMQDKHNTALVRIITKAIASGDRGADSIVYNDGGNAATQMGTFRCSAPT